MSTFDAARLVGRLTLEQKVAQLRGLFATELVVASPHGHAFDPSQVSIIRPHGVGHISMAWFLAEKADQLRSQLDADPGARPRDLPVRDRRDGALRGDQRGRP